jgi:hypothetical protein
MRYITPLPLLLAFFMIAVLAAGCGTGPDEEINSKQTSFDQFPTHALKVHQGFVYAGTDSGLYRKPVYPDNTQWESLGLRDKKVINLVFLSKDKMLAAVRVSDFSGGIPSLFLSTDQGQSWQIQMGNYGGETGEFTWVGAIDSPAPSSDTVFARVGGRTVVRSINGGNSWKVVNGQWNHWGGAAVLVKVDPHHKNTIWAGGVNAFSHPYLLKSTDNGETWKDLKRIGTSEQVCYDVLTHPKDRGQVLAGLYGNFVRSLQIRKSTDGGNTWTTVKDSIGTLTLIQSSSDGNTVYASGVNMASTLFFARSDNFGETWQQVAVPGAPGDIRTNDMVSVMADGQEVLYFGTNKGVYRYRLEE